MKHSIGFCGIFSKFKTDFYCISYSNSCFSCSFELEIINIGQSSHKIYSNNILNFQESTTIINACTKKILDIFKKILTE